MASKDKKVPKPPQAASSSTKKKNNKTPSSSSFSWTLSLLVLLIAVGISALYYAQPHHVNQWIEHSKTRVLQLMDSYRSIGEAPASFSCEEAQQYLTDVHPVKGFHVLCVKKTDHNTLEIHGFKDGFKPNAARTAESPIDLQAFRSTNEKLFEIPQPNDPLAKQYKQPFAFFSPTGDQLTTLRSMVNRIVFLFEGGQFIWPGIQIGYKRTIPNVYGKGDVVMETLAMIPLVFAVEEFLKDDEIDKILELSMDHLKPSGVTLMDGDEDRPATDWRTSSTYFLPSSSHQIVQNIDQRTADLVKVPISHQEDVQVLRYEETQKYDQHTDYFPPEHHQNQPDVLQWIEHGYKNRMITVFWYMSDVAKGGHTIFPRAGGKPQPSSMKDCTKGLKVPPKKRKVIVFYSMLPNGQSDPMSLHGGCPVEEGTKYSGNKWVIMRMGL